MAMVGGGPQRPDEVPRVKQHAAGAEQQVTSRWWLSDTPGRDMVSVAKQLDKEQEQRRRIDAVFCRAYTGRQLRNVYDYQAARVSAPVLTDPYGLGTRLSLNVIQSIIESLAAKIAKNKPRAFVTTDGGSWALQRQGKALMKFLDGMMHAQKAYATGRRVFIDACVTGTGIFKVVEDPDPDEAQVSIERTIPGSVFTNDAEAVEGKPRTLYQKRLVHRAVLEEIFAKGKSGEAALARGAAIEDADGWDAAKDAASSTSDVVWVYEGWATKGGAKGWVTAIDHEGGELQVRPWTKKYHPFVFHRRRMDMTGVWGIGLAEDLLGIQLEINKLLQRIREAHHLVAVPRVFVKPGAKLAKNQLTNEVGIIIETEEPPTFMVAPAMAGEVYSHLWNLYAKAYEISGVSQLSATGSKPAGINAAVALREMQDIESERFVLDGQTYEESFMDVSRLGVDTARDMYSRGKSVEVKAPGTKFITTIDWKKVDLKENQYDIKTFPTSILPTTPAGRLQKVQEMYEAGLIPDRETAMSLLDAPDLEGAMSLQLAAIDDVKRILEKLTEDGEYETPEPFMNLDLALRMTQSEILKQRQFKDFPEKRLELLLRFMDAVRDLAADMEPPAPPQPALPEGPAQVAGAPTPGPALPALPSPAVASALPALA